MTSVTVVYTLIVFICCFLFVHSKPPSTNRIHWVLIHYHKTGHDLCGYFGDEVFSSNITTNKCRKVHRNYCKNLDTDDDILKLLSSDVTIIKPHEFKWVRAFDREGHQFQIVHFVREPFDMVMSSYLYHKELPPPESWLNMAEYDPCHYVVADVEGEYIPALQLYMGNKANVTDMFNKVINLCYQLSAQYPAKSYSKVLNSVRNGDDLFDGVRMEAARDLLRGDHLKMMYHLLQERLVKGSKHVNIRRTYTSEFPVQDIEMYRRSTLKVYDFLMPSNENNKPFYKCLDNKEKAVESALTVAFASLPKMVSVNASKDNTHKAELHITGDLMTKDARQKYMKRLEQDPVLGPFLTAIKKIENNEEYK